MAMTDRDMMKQIVEGGGNLEVTQRVPIDLLVELATRAAETGSLITVYGNNLGPAERTKLLSICSAKITFKTGPVP